MDAHGRGCGAPLSRWGRAHGLGAARHGTRAGKVLQRPGLGWTARSRPSRHRIRAIRPSGAAPSVPGTIRSGSALRTLRASANPAVRLSSPQWAEPIRTQRGCRAAARSTGVCVTGPVWTRISTRSVVREPVVVRPARRGDVPDFGRSCCRRHLRTEASNCLARWVIVPNRDQTYGGFSRPSPSRAKPPGASSPHNKPRPLRRSDQLPVDFQRDISRVVALRLPISRPEAMLTRLCGQVAA